MRTLKKSLALVLALVMVLGLGVVGASADNKLDSYTDAGEIGDAYVEAVGVLTGLGIVDGRTDTEIVPEATYNRAEAAKIIAYMLLGKDQADALKATVAPFEDVSVDFWAAGYIAYCAELGIISGMTETTFEPYGTLTGYQWAKMLLVAVGYGKNGEFEGDSWSLNTATVVAKTGLNEGDLAAADHVALRREQAMLFAFNALNLKQVTYSPNSTNYVYDIFGYVFADGTGTTLGEDVYDLAMVEGQIVDNEGMGNANTIVDPVNKWAKEVTIDANTDYDLMWHAVRVWYVDGKTNTNVYVTDLAETTVYECMNMAAGTKEANKKSSLEKQTIGDAEHDTAYEAYLIDNSALDLAKDWAYVTLYADLGTLGRIGKTETNVDGVKVDNDIILTDISEIEYGSSIIYVTATSTQDNSDKAWHVWATTGTEGVVSKVSQSAGKVVSVTLSDGTVLPMSSFWTQNDGVDGETFVINRNYKFVLDTHGDVVKATLNYARDVYYYTGDSRPAYEFNAWSSDKTTEYRFLNVTDGTEYIVPLTDATDNVVEGFYYDLSAAPNSKGEYTAKWVWAGSNPYAEEYVIDSFELTKQTNSVWTMAWSWDYKDHVVYFDTDKVTYIVAKGSGENMTVEKYAGYDELKADYNLSLDSGFIFNNACFTVSDTRTGNKYSEIVFIHEQYLDAYSNYLFVPEDINVHDWNEGTGDAENYTFKYEDAAYMDGTLVDISFTYEQCVKGTTDNIILERGFYTSKYDGRTGTYSLIERLENDADGHAYYQHVWYADTMVGGTWVFNGTYSAVEGETVVIDCTGEYDEAISLYELYKYDRENRDLRLAFTVNPANDHVSYVYVVEKGWQNGIHVSLSEDLQDAGWSIKGAASDGVYTIGDNLNAVQTVILVNENTQLGLQESANYNGAMGITGTWRSNGVGGTTEAAAGVYFENGYSLKVTFTVPTGYEFPADRDLYVALDGLTLNTKVADGTYKCKPNGVVVKPEGEITLGDKVTVTLDSINKYEAGKLCVVVLDAPAGWNYPQVVKTGRLDWTGHEVTVEFYPIANEYTISNWCYWEDYDFDA